MPITLINIFNVPSNKEEEEEEGFLQHWNKTTEVFRRKIDLSKPTYIAHRRR